MKCMMFVAVVYLLGLLAYGVVSNADDTGSAVDSIHVGFAEILNFIDANSDKISDSIEVVERCYGTDICMLGEDEIAFAMNKSVTGFLRTAILERIRDESEDIIIKRKPNEGYLRIIDKSAVRSHFPGEPKGIYRLNFEESRVRTTVLGFLADLRIPENELGDIDVKTVVERGGSENGVELERESEYLITVYRRIADVAVADSRARVAVNESGEVIRALIQWPEIKPLAFEHRLDNAAVAQRIDDALASAFVKNSYSHLSMGVVIAEQRTEHGLAHVPAVRVMAFGNDGPAVGFNIPVVE